MSTDDAMHLSGSMVASSFGKLVMKDDPRDGIKVCICVYKYILCVCIYISYVLSMCMMFPTLYAYFLLIILIRVLSYHTYAMYYTLSYTLSRVYSTYAYIL